jgi:hypothetical protein
VVPPEPEPVEAELLVVAAGVVAGVAAPEISAPAPIPRPSAPPTAAMLTATFVHLLLIDVSSMCVTVGPAGAGDQADLCHRNGHHTKSIWEPALSRLRNP